jgi:hypothetical protein
MFEQPTFVGNLLISSMCLAQLNKLKMAPKDLNSKYVMKSSNKYTQTSKASKSIFNISEYQRKGSGSGMFPFNNKQTLQWDQVFCKISGVANILYKSKIVFYYYCRPCLGNHLEPDVQFKAHMKQAVLETCLSKLEEQTNVDYCRK